MKGEKYKKNLDNHFKRLKRKEIDRDEFERLSRREDTLYLVRENLRNSENKDIFKRVIGETKHRYARLKDDYYCGRMTRAEYLTRRESDEGTGWFDFSLFDYGLSTRRWKKKEREFWLVKSFKVERSILPERLISPRNLAECPPEVYIAARETMRVVFESIDAYFDQYVPSMKGVKLRDLDWIENDQEREAFKLGYVDIEVTNSDRRKYRRWRDA